MGQVFVRAKPKKISVKETYHYKAIVGINNSLDFDRAEGEITIEFLFDGQRNGSFTSEAKKDIQQQKLVGTSQKAQVGHLAILKGGRSSWKKLGYEGQTIPLRIDIGELEKKLESSQKLVIKYLYYPDKPEGTFVRLGKVELRDQDTIHGNTTADFSIELYPYPIFFMQLIASLPDELVNAIDLTPDRLKQLLELQKSVEVAFLAGNTTSEEIYTCLKELAKDGLGGYLFIGVESNGKISGLSESETESLPARVIKASLMGPSPIPLTKPSIREVSSDDSDKKLGIIIVPPEAKDQVNEVGREGDIFIEKDNVIQADLIDELIARGETQEIVFASKDIKADELAKLFVALANTGGGFLLFGVQTVQNTQAGYPNGVTDEEINSIWGRVKQALNLVRPSLWPFCKHNYVQLDSEQNDELVKVLAIQVPDKLQQVYSTEAKCWRREAKGRPDQENRVFVNRELTPDEVFEFFVQRYGFIIEEAVAVKEPPRVTFGYVYWPYTVLKEINNSSALPGANSANKPDKDFYASSRTENNYLPSKYDPARGALEWHEAKLVKKTGNSFYSGNLLWEIKNPQDLWQSKGAGSSNIRNLMGHFDVLLGPVLLSGLKISYYDTLGISLTASKQQEIISYQTFISLDVELRVNELFHKRKQILRRHLEFDGILPERERWNDVKETLNDLAFRIEAEESNSNLYRHNLPKTPFLTAKRRSKVGEFYLLVQMINRWYPIQREISYGQRVDKREVPSGRIALDIYGTVEGGDSMELVGILNQLQQQLKERFEYVKVS